MPAIFDNCRSAVRIAWSHRKILRDEAWRLFSHGPADFHKADRQTKISIAAMLAMLLVLIAIGFQTILEPEDKRSLTEIVKASRGKINDASDKGKSLVKQSNIQATPDVLANAFSRENEKHDSDRH